MNIQPMGSSMVKDQPPHPPKVRTWFAPKTEVVSRAVGWQWVIICLIVAITAGFTIFGYEQGRQRGLEVRHHALMELKSVRAGLLKLNLELEKTWLEIGHINKGGLMEHQMQQDLKNHIRALEEQISLQKKNIAFYRSILSPTAEQEGLRIERIDLIVEDERHAEMNLVLSQVKDEQSIIDGTVRVDLMGEKDGKQVKLSLSEVAKLSTYPLRFRFKYLQEFPAVLELPEGFEPYKINVIVDVDGRNGVGTATRSFKWSQLQG